MKRDFFTTIFIQESVSSGLSLAAKPLALINSLVVISYLSVYDFGVYTLLLSFYTILSGISISFLDNLVLNEMNRSHKIAQNNRGLKLFLEYAFVKLIIGVALTASVFLLSPVIAHSFEGTTIIWIQILSLLFILDNIRSCLMIYFQYKLHFYTVSTYTVLYELLKLFAILFIGFTWNLSITNLLLLTIVTHATLLPFFFTVLYRRKQVTLSLYQLRKKKWRAKDSQLIYLIRLYGVWTIARYYLLLLIQNARPWIINLFLGKEAVAIFTVALNFSGSIKSLVSFATVKVYLPRELDNFDRLENIFLRGIKYSSVLYTILFVAGVTVVPMGVILFLPNYTPAIPFFLILAFGILFHGANTISGQLVYALRKQKELFYIPFGTSLLSLSFLFIGIRYFGLHAAAIEVVVSQIIIGAAYFWIVRKNMPELFEKWKQIFSWDNYDAVFLKKLLNIPKTFFVRKI